MVQEQQISFNSIIRYRNIVRWKESVDITKKIGNTSIMAEKEILNKKRYKR